MTLKKNWNTTILCVDSNENILDAYTDILKDIEYNCTSEIKKISTSVKNLFENVTNTDAGDFDTEPIKYNIIQASTLEDAIDILRDYKERSEPIAVGFFDVHLSGPGGIELIRESKKIMPDMMTCVVSSATFKHEQALKNIFETGTEWMCLSKPFSKYQLLQTAFHLVSAWNLRQERANFENDLSLSLKLIRAIDKIDVLANADNYQKTLLQNIIDFVESDQGMLLFKSVQGLTIERTINFDTSSVEIEAIMQTAQKVLETKQIIGNKHFLFLPLMEKTLAAVVVIPFMELTWTKQKMLYIFLKLLATNSEQLLYAKSNLSKEIEKKEQNYNILRSIASTLCHHINNPLAIVKGFAEMTLKRTDNKKIKSNMLKITKSADNIAGIVEILGTLDTQGVNRVIDTQIGIQIIDIDKQVQEIKEELDNAYKEKEDAVAEEV